MGFFQNIGFEHIRIFLFNAKQVFLAKFEEGEVSDGEKEVGGRFLQTLDTQAQEILLG
jgi:hypothetical protein